MVSSVRNVQAKFKTGMWEMKILGSEVLWYVFTILVQEWHLCKYYLFRVVQAKFEIGMHEMKIFGLKFVVCLGTLIQDGLAHMRGVIWQAVSAKFKKGICEMKKFGSEIYFVIWKIGSGWVGTYAWDNMESFSGKVQNRDV